MSCIRSRERSQSFLQWSKPATRAIERAFAVTSSVSMAAETIKTVNPYCEFSQIVTDFARSSGPLFRRPTRASCHRSIRADATSRPHC